MTAGGGAHRLFRSVEVPPEWRGLLTVGPQDAQAIIDDNVRLQRFYQGPRRTNLPKIDQVAFAVGIEPQDVDFSVVGQQFLQLAIHEIHILLVVPHAVIGICPISRRIINAEVHAGRMASVRELLERIALERRAGNVEIRKVSCRTWKTHHDVCRRRPYISCRRSGRFAPIVWHRIVRGRIACRGSSYSGSSTVPAGSPEISSGLGPPRDQLSSRPSRLTGPQWINRPYLASCHQAMRVSYCSALSPGHCLGGDSCARRGERTGASSSRPSRLRRMYFSWEITFVVAACDGDRATRGIMAFSSYLVADSSVARWAGDGIKGHVNRTGRAVRNRINGRKRRRPVAAKQGAT